MGKKQLAYAMPFVSRHGKHTVSSIGRDLNLHKYSKYVTNKANDALGKFKMTDSTLHKIDEVVRAIKFTADTYTGLRQNDPNSIINHGYHNLPMISQSSTTNLGREGKIYKINSHIGKHTSSRILKLRESPHIIKERKLTADSLRDYQSTVKRKELILQCGFNEKLFSFGAEDTYFSVHDFYEFFDVKKRFEKKIKADTDGITEIFGCVYGTKHKLRIRNQMDLYTSHIKIHLVKITDTRLSVRDLINDFTVTSLQPVNAQQLSGKIPIDLQYTEPKIYNRSNKFQTSFVGDLSLNLNQISRFYRNAKIIKSWYRSIPAGSILEFDYHHHYGKGVPINRLIEETDNFLEYSQMKIAAQNSNLIKEFQFNVTSVEDAKEKMHPSKIGAEAKKLFEQLDAKKSLSDNNEHPVGYVILIESIGDKKAPIQRKEDESIFEGYAPVNLKCEFSTELIFLAEETEDVNGAKIPLTYTRSKLNFNFDETYEDSNGINKFEELFCPNRMEKLHINYKDIQFNNGLGKGGPYKLIYDQILSGSGTDLNMLDDMKTILKNLDLDTSNLNPDDLEYNYSKEPNEASSKDDILDLDEGSAND